MTRFEANYIKYLRVRLDGSWRWVSAKYKDRYRYSLPFSHETDSVGLQMEGSDICAVAMSFLGETNEDGWN